MGLNTLLGIFLAAASSMALGAFWYSLKGFGGDWMKLSGMSKKTSKKDMKRSYSYATFSVIIMSAVMAYMVSWARSESAVTGAGLGVMLWIGFVATTSASGVLWEKKPFGLYVINSTYWLFALVLIGAITGAMA